MSDPGFVLDASIALSWAFEEGATPQSDMILERLRTEAAIVAPIWAFEITNGLVVAERRGRITATGTHDFLESLRQLPIMIDVGFCELRLEELAQLARRTKLPACDASYLYLSKVRGLPLATLDRSLDRAAELHGVSVFP